jgi:Dipeptidyl aminopeptidases/acylaminoacyl-peptidases
LLIGQGQNDPRVNVRESDQIVAAMRAKGLPVEYVVYTDEGHGFARPQNRLDFYGRVEPFLAKYRGRPRAAVRGGGGQLGGGEVARAPHRGPNAGRRPDGPPASSSGRREAASAQGAVRPAFAASSSAFRRAGSNSSPGYQRGSASAFATPRPTS